MLLFFERAKQWLMGMLPTSPFRDFLDRFADIPYLSYLNWVVPVADILAVMAVWLTAIGIFYLCSILLRWIKVLGD